MSEDENINFDEIKAFLEKNPGLYNIFKDPGENHNLADVHAERAKSMTQKVISWYKSMPILEIE